MLFDLWPWPLVMIAVGSTEQFLSAAAARKIKPLAMDPPNGVAPEVDLLLRYRQMWCLLVTMQSMHDDITDLLHHNPLPGVQLNTAEIVQENERLGQQLAEQVAATAEVVAALVPRLGNLRQNPQQDQDGGLRDR